MPERQKCETKPTPVPRPRALTPGADPTMPEKQKYQTKPKPPSTATSPCPVQTCAARPSDYSSFLVHRSAFLAPPRPLTRAAGPTTPGRQKNETKPTPVTPARALTRGASPTMPRRQEYETKPTPLPPPRPLSPGAGPAMPETQKRQVAERGFPPPAPATTLLTRLYHTARTLAVYASPCRSPGHHARLAARWVANPSRTGLAPAGLQRKVSAHASPFPRLILAQAKRSQHPPRPAQRDDPAGRLHLRPRGQPADHAGARSVKVSGRFSRRKLSGRTLRACRLTA